MNIGERGKGKGGFIAREGIEHSQSRQPQRCIPCHADVEGDLFRRVAAPAAKAKFYWGQFSFFARPKPGVRRRLFFVFFASPVFFCFCAPCRMIDALLLHFSVFLLRAGFISSPLRLFERRSFISFSISCSLSTISRLASVSGSSLSNNRRSSRPPSWVGPILVLFLGPSSPAFVLRCCSLQHFGYFHHVSF